MIFSPLDALIFRRRPRAAQRRVEIFVGALIVLVGTPCGFFAAATLPGQLCWAGLSLVVGIGLIVGARRGAENELTACADRTDESAQSSNRA
jgi:hypothetical protein